MNYTVEFPFPDEYHRELLWRGMFPPDTPLGDLHYMLETSSSKLSTGTA
jgi:hypothetical protein